MRSDTCGIDPGELTPFQGGTVYWTVPGVETRLKPRAESCSPFGAKNRPNPLLILAPFGTGQIREKVKEGAIGIGIAGANKLSSKAGDGGGVAKVC